MATRADYLKTIGTGVDEANLTDQQLQDRLAAYQGLGSTKGDIDRATIVRTLTKELSNSNVKDNVDALANQIADYTLQTGRYPNADELKNAFAKDTIFSHSANKAVDKEGGGGGWEGGAIIGNAILPGGPGAAGGALGGGLSGSGGGDTYLRKGYLPPELENFFNDQNIRNNLSGIVSGFVNPPDTASDVTRVQGLVNDRAQKAASNAKINEFLTTAPGQLDAERQKFYDAQRNQAKDYITGEYAPQVAERLAARGLGDSGQVGSSITSKYSNLLEGIDSSQLDQMNQDADYFANQQYNKVYSDLVNAKQDVTSTIANDQSTLRSNQLAGFSKAQQNLENQFNLDLFKTQSQAAYDTYQKQNQAAKQAAHDKQIADTINQGAQTAVTIGAAALL